MTSEIRLEQATIEHMTMQPMDLRYALFCDDVKRGKLDGRCTAQNRGGHIGDFGDYRSARGKGLTHPHSVLIRFYPTYDNRQPSPDFLQASRKSSRV